MDSAFLDFRPLKVLYHACKVPNAHHKGPNIHTHTHTPMAQPLVQCLAEADMQTGGTGDRKAF